MWVRNNSTKPIKAAAPRSASADHRNGRPKSDRIPAGIRRSRAATIRKKMLALGLAKDATVSNTPMKYGKALACPLLSEPYC
jgi:hypothetical protein